MDIAEQLYAIEEIRRLKARYCYCVDDFFADPHALDLLLSDVLSRDVRGSFRQGNATIGAFRGRAEAESFFREVVYGTLSFCQHLVHNPLIDLSDTHRAAGRWYFLVPCTFRNGSTAGWLSGTYRELYLRTQDGWRIDAMEADFSFLTSHEAGWARARNVLAAGSGEPCGAAVPPCDAILS